MSSPSPSTSLQIRFLPVTPGLPLKEQTLKVAYTALGAAGALMAAAKIVFPAHVLALDFPGTVGTAELCRAQRVLGGALLPGVAAAFVLRVSHF